MSCKTLGNPSNESLLCDECRGVTQAPETGNGVGMDQGDKQVQVTELRAYLMVGGDGAEGIPAVSLGGHVVPLMGGDPVTLEKMAPIAQQVADQMQVPVTLARFGSREDVVTMFPLSPEDVAAIERGMALLEELREEDDATEAGSEISESL